MVSDSALMLAWVAKAPVCEGTMDSTVVGRSWLLVVADDSVISLCINPPTAVNAFEVAEDVADIVDEATLIGPGSPPCPTTDGWVVDAELAILGVVEVGIEALDGVVIAAGITGAIGIVWVFAGGVDAEAGGIEADAGVLAITSCA